AGAKAVIKPVKAISEKKKAIFFIFFRFFMFGSRSQEFLRLVLGCQI
ncbi:MAG: hypothetical protein ACI920_001581, partial [Saprospiraceae bacterium]